MTKLSLEIEGKKVTWEIDDDSPFCSDLLEAFVGLMVTHTFSERCVLNSMKDMVDERRPDGVTI